MAQRPVYTIRLNEPFYRCHMVDFEYNPGFAVSQKQKNIKAIHDAYHRINSDSKILEISSKSLQPLGVSLSAFNLMKYVPSIDQKICVENIFQGGKVFNAAGPFTDLYSESPKNAKRDDRLRQNGALKGFYFEGNTYPLSPKTAFYDWIYISALLENNDLAEELVQFDAFTDVEFNPAKSLNCQAKAAAIFVSLKRTGKTDVIKSFDEFKKIYRVFSHS